MVPCCILEELRSGALNTDTLHGIPATPAPDHHPQLPFPPADGDDRPPGTPDPGGAVEGLLHERRFDLADIRCLHRPLLSRRAPFIRSPRQTALEELRRVL